MLGPATVVESAGDRVRLVRESGEAWAQLALAFPYEPAAGDVVLAIGEDEVFIIGVLRGRGKSVFRTPGDLELEAGGRVSIRGSEVRIEADKVETVARSVFERFVNAYRWVKETLQTRAGRTRTVVEGHSTLRAERIVEIAEKDVKIDGEKIHLG
jgi:hypothetical protein